MIGRSLLCSSGLFTTTEALSIFLPVDLHDLLQDEVNVDWSSLYAFGKTTSAFLDVRRLYSLFAAFVQVIHGIEW